MHNNIKNYLGIAGIAGIIMFGLAVLSYVSTYSKSIEPSSFRSFTASGEGKAIGIPDIAKFSFSVITEGGKDIAGLQKENTEKTKKAIDFLKSEGIDTKDITTENYDLQPRYQYSNCYGPENTGRVCPPPEIVGYSINQTVSVKIRTENFEKIGKILTGVISSGANSTSQLNFTIDDPSEIQMRAREMAIEKAKENAKSIARAGGFRIGRLLSIDENFYYPQPTYYKGDRGAMEIAPSDAPAIEPGSKDITVNVVLRYEIE